MNTPKPLQGWHLDKRVPITLILALLIQTAGVVWFAAKIETRVTMLEDEQAELKADLKQEGQELSEVVTELAVVARSLEATNDGLGRVERRLDALIDAITRD